MIFHRGQKPTTSGNGNFRRLEKKIIKVVSVDIYIHTDIDCPTVVDCPTHIGRPLGWWLPHWRWLPHRHWLPHPNHSFIQSEFLFSDLGVIFWATRFPHNPGPFLLIWVPIGPLTNYMKVVLEFINEASCIQYVLGRYNGLGRATHPQRLAASGRFLYENMIFWL